MGVVVSSRRYETYGSSRGQLQWDGTRGETRFRLSAKRTSPFKSAGPSVQSTIGSRVVPISGSNVGNTMFRGSVKGTGYPLHWAVSPSSAPMRHRVPSHFNWSLLSVSHDNWAATDWVRKRPLSLSLSLALFVFLCAHKQERRRICQGQTLQCTTFAAIIFSRIIQTAMRESAKEGGLLYSFSAHIVWCRQV